MGKPEKVRLEYQGRRHIVQCWPCEKRTAYVWATGWLIGCVILTSPVWAMIVYHLAVVRGANSIVYELVVRQGVLSIGLIALGSVWYIGGSYKDVTFLFEGEKVYYNKGDETLDGWKLAELDEICIYGPSNDTCGIGIWLDGNRRSVSLCATREATVNMCNWIRRADHGSLLRTTMNLEQVG